MHSRAPRTTSNAGSRSFSRRPDQKRRALREEIRENPDLAGAFEEDTLLDGPLLQLDQAFEILDGEEMDVGRIEPVVREQLGFGSAAGEHMRQTHAPVAEVRERDDGAASDSQHFAQHFERSARFLQRLAEDYVVERLIREIGERVLDVAVKDRNASGNRLPDFSALDLDAASIHAFVFRKP